jgi:hypothetical protein
MATVPVPIGSRVQACFVRCALVSLLAAVGVPARAQYEPSAPIAPTSAQECNAYATAMSQYRLVVSNAHTQCLASHNKPGQSLAEPNYQICSQAACQSLHDLVYGPRAADGDRKVSACFAEVNQRMARQAEEQRLREQQEREQAAQREKQRQQEEADRARRATERAAWEAREEKRKQAELQKRQEVEARLKGAKDESARRELVQERDSELARIAQERTADAAPVLLPPLAPPSTFPANDLPRDSGVFVEPTPPPPQLGKEVLSQITTDAFGGGTRPLDTSAISANPSQWTDPFPATAKNPHADEVFGKTTDIAAKGAENAVNTLERDIEAARKAGNVKYLEAAEDTRSVLKSVGRMIQFADYAAAAGKVINADTDKKREEATGDLGFKIASDVAKLGFEKYATTVFGEKVAAVLLGPVAFVASIGADVVTPAPTARDPQEIIRDQSGASSLTDKREALYTIWRQYSRYGDQWQPVQKKQLEELTDIVYREAKGGGQ